MSVHDGGPASRLVDLDPAKLLGLDQLASAGADDASLRASLDAAHNKVGSEPDYAPAPPAS